LQFGDKVEIGKCYLFTQDRVIKSDPYDVNSLLYALIHCVPRHPPPKTKTVLGADMACYKENI